MIKITIEAKTFREACSQIRTLAERFGVYDDKSEAKFTPCEDCNEFDYCNKHGCKFSPKKERLREDGKPFTYTTDDMESELG